ncbi:MAG: HAD family hydrolase [Candidatus Sericytochromatia bacterium]|uniref:HAD family hydrolase n=1 Tax=Candidatus Tanganyikabacteria bacterium TaxID=2961651 RepID=A0A937X5U1_9BACT|nr:HAD family hydrolase [Candidatus Tanganyikabacteria bacterium]
MPGGPAELRAIVFDKDGVLVDFQRYWGAITQARVLGVGLDPERDAADFAELMALLGMPDGQVDPDGSLVLASRKESAAMAAGFLYRRRHMKWVDARTLVEQAFEAAYTLVPADALRPLPGVVDAILALRDRGWLMAVATTDHHDHALQSLRRSGIAECFGAIVGADQVSRGKPDPEMYRLACERLGVVPAETVVVGDGINDLRMGRSAGCHGTIGVLSGVSRRDDLAEAADLIVPGLPGLLAIAP